MRVTLNLSTWRAAVVAVTVIVFVAGVVLDSYGYVTGTDNARAVGEMLWGIPLFLGTVGGIGYLLGRLDRTRPAMLRRVEEINTHVTRLDEVTTPLPGELQRMKLDLVTELRQTRQWMQQANERLAAVEDAIPDAEIRHLPDRDARGNDERT